MGRRRHGRAIDGVLVLDKPAGMTSNAALQKVRRLFNAAKAGHTGSLDPLATGVLPICFGEATKFSQYLLDADKIYRSTFVLGVSTNTADAEGDVMATANAASVTALAVENALRSLRGEIEQIPPMFSALKVNGQPLYKLARQGKEIGRNARPVTIRIFDIESFRPGELAEVDVYIECSKGTYVRSLAEQLGQILGVGGHVKTLRRVSSGHFDGEQQVSLEDLHATQVGEHFAELDQHLLPLTTLLGDMPKLNLDSESVFYLLRGQSVFVPRAPTQGEVCMLDEAGAFIGVGVVAEDGKIAPRRTIANN